MAAAWHELPALVFEVISYLKSNRDVLNAAAVCKKWADAAAVVPLPAKLHWSSDNTDVVARAWMSRNWCRVQKLALSVADGEDQQAAAQQLLAEAQGAASLHHLRINASGDAALPEATWSLASLNSLCLTDSWHPKLLPACVARLTVLQQLVLNNCGLRELPDSLGQLQHLTQLTFNDCHYLKCLPNSLCQLSGLQRLTLRLCTALAQLPPSLGCLSSLSHLSISLCYSLSSLPASLCSLPALQHLHLASNYELQELPQGLGGMQLNGHDTCDSSSGGSWKLSGLAASLTSLYVSGSHYLQQLPASVGQLSKLRSLTVSNCNGLSGLPSCLSGLSSLSSLTLSHCPAIVHLPATLAADLAALQQLLLRQCSSLLELPDELQGHGQLSRLVLQGCWGLTKLPAGLAEVPGLLLDVRNCPGLQAKNDGRETWKLCKTAEEDGLLLQQQQCGPQVTGVLQQLGSMSLVAGSADCRSPMHVRVCCLVSTAP